MRRLALPLLLVALASCGKLAPETPTPAAIGAELATFPQLLVPISTQTWAAMAAASERGDGDHSAANRYAKPYAHGVAHVDGRESPVFVGYSSVLLAPAPVPLQPMSVQQFLSAFALDDGTNLASVIAPKGAIFLTREQLPELIGAARTAGATAGDMPYSVVRGEAR